MTPTGEEASSRNCPAQGQTWTRKRKSQFAFIFCLEFPDPFCNGLSVVNVSFAPLFPFQLRWLRRCVEAPAPSERLSPRFVRVGHAAAGKLSARRPCIGKKATAAVEPHSRSCAIHFVLSVFTITFAAAAFVLFIFCTFSLLQLRLSLLTRACLALQSAPLFQPSTNTSRHSVSAPIINRLLDDVIPSCASHAHCFDLGRRSISLAFSTSQPVVAAAVASRRRLRRDP